MPRQAQKWPDPRYLPAYSLAEAAHYLSMPASTVRAWMLGQAGFQPVISIADAGSRTLSFVNMVEAHVLSAIRRRHNIPLPRVRTAIEYVTQKLGVDRPLADQRFETDGVDLFVQMLDGRILNVSRGGQGRLEDMIRGHLKRIERDTHGMPIKLFPLVRGDAPEQPRSVVIDPKVSFGRPIVVGTGIPTAVLAERFKAGDTIQALADDYRADPQAIEDAIRCELDLRLAA